MLRRPPRSPLLPSTTLFQSGRELAGDDAAGRAQPFQRLLDHEHAEAEPGGAGGRRERPAGAGVPRDRKSTRLNSSHANISYAVFCLKKKKINSLNSMNSNLS